MQNWNVVVTVHEQGFGQAIRLLEEYGPVLKTEFFNVLALRADDIPGLLESLRQRVEAEPGLLNILARLVPVTRTFKFTTAQEFETKAQEIALAWAGRLAGKSFYVRMHRRGFKGRLASTTEERRLDDILLQALAAAGTPGRIVFTDPDAVLAVETIGQWAGMSLWSREELARLPFLNLA